VIRLIDFHAHHQQLPHLEAVKVIQSAMDAGIDRIVLGGTDPTDWKTQVQLWMHFKGKIFLNFGLHPWWVEKFSREEIDQILQQLDQELPLVAGLGEAGLDFYPGKRDPARFEDQRYAFRAQLQLALKHQKPVVLHIVSAHEEARTILKEEWGKVAEWSAVSGAGAVTSGTTSGVRSHPPIIIHRFSGTAEDARAWLALGAYLSFHEPKKIMKTIPVERLLLESDSHTGVHPGGWDLRPHYQKSAEIMGLAPDVFAQKLAENFNEIGYSQPQ
jgi:TatD DNase family protein